MGVCMLILLELIYFFTSNSRFFTFLKLDFHQLSSSYLKFLPIDLLGWAKVNGFKALVKN
jgi:hypothetical protein